MRKLIAVALAVLCVASAQADSIKTPAGDLQFKRGGVVAINGTRVDGPLDSDGRPFHLFREPFFNLNEKWDQLFLLGYLTFDSSYLPTTHYLILDTSTGKATLSNAVDVASGSEYKWGDNNFSLVRDGVLYFGIYAPRRVQFAYKDGRLEEFRGPWMGPQRPVRYIEPEESERGPCFNVANVPECIAEIERAQAARPAGSASSAKRDKSKSPSSAASR